MTDPPAQKMTCKYCDGKIELARFGKHYKWVTSKANWQCGNDPAYPVRGHQPKIWREKMTDPNQTLIDARNAIGDYRNAISMQEVERSANQLADTFEAMDEWLCKGGFLPADWLPARNMPTAG